MTHYEQACNHHSNHRKDRYTQQCGGTTSMFVGKDKELTDMDRFKNRVRRCKGIWESEDIYFSQMKDGYYADYRPKYPEKTCGDYTIYENPLQYRIILYAPNAPEFGSIKKEYSNWDEVWKEFQNIAMEETILKVLDEQIDGFICPNQSEFQKFTFTDTKQFFEAIYNLVDKGVLRKRDCEGLAYEYNK